MPKYDVVATIFVTVEARDRTRANSAVKDSLKDFWWQDGSIGFASSRFRVTCDRIKVNSLRKKHA